MKDKKSNGHVEVGIKSVSVGVIFWFRQIQYSSEDLHSANKMEKTFVSVPIQ